jgi:hypothetical protein
MKSEVKTKLVSRDPKSKQRIGTPYRRDGTEQKSDLNGRITTNARSETTAHTCGLPTGREGDERRDRILRHEENHGGIGWNLWRPRSLGSVEAMGFLEGVGAVVAVRSFPSRGRGRTDGDGQRGFFFFFLS